MSTRNNTAADSEKTDLHNGRQTVARKVLGAVARAQNVAVRAVIIVRRLAGHNRSEVGGYNAAKRHAPNQVHALLLRRNDQSNQ